MSNLAQEVKRRVRVEDLARSAGIELKRNGSKFVGLCPFHDDRKTPNLNVSPEPNTFKCFACGAGGTPIDWVMLRDDIVFKDALRLLAEECGLANNAPTRRLVEEYPYLRAGGSTAFIVRRYEPKDFRQGLPDGTGGWIPGLGSLSPNDRALPYRLPDLLSADGPILIVEGEKDANAAWQLGLAATCNAGGAKKWRDGHTAHLPTGRLVVVVPDADEVGGAHADLVAVSCRRAGFDVKLLDLGTDLSDWCNNGGDADKLAGVIAEAPDYTTVSDNEATVVRRRFVPVSAADLLSEPIPEVDWLVEGLIPRGGLVLIVGEPDVGKTWFLLQLSLCLAEGDCLLGEYKCAQAPVILFEEDDSRTMLQQRLANLNRAEAIASDSLQHLHLLPQQHVWLQSDDDVSAIVETIQETGAEVVVFDPFRRIHGANENDSTEMASVLNTLRLLEQENGVTVFVAHHSGKWGEGSQKGIFLGRGSSDIPAAARTILNLKAIEPPPDGCATAFELSTGRCKEAAPGRAIRVGLRVDGDAARLVRLEDAPPPPSKEEEAATAARTFILTHGDTWFSIDELLKELGEMHSEKAVRGALNSLAESGKIEHETRDKGKYFFRCLQLGSLAAPIGDGETAKLDGTINTLPGPSPKTPGTTEQDEWNEVPQR